MKSYRFDEIEQARIMLGLGEKATMKEIRSAYRKLAHYHHPDKQRGIDTVETEIMKGLNRAYKLLTDYCADYRYSFRQGDVAGTDPEEEEYKRWHEKWTF